MDNLFSPNSNNHPVEDENINKQRAFGGAIIFTIVALTSFVFAIFLVSRSPIWQVYAITSITAVALAADIIGTVSIWRGKTALGLKYLYWSLLFTIPPNALLVTNTTPFLIGIVLVVGFVHVFYLQPRAWRKSYQFGPVIASVFMVVVDVIQPAFRTSLVSQTTISGYWGPIMLAFLVISLIVLIVRLAWAGNIRLKIITAFMVVALVSLGILGTVTYINYRNQVREDIRQRLLNIVSITALQQDGDLFATIQTAEDMQGDAYQKMQAGNHAILATDRDLAYVWSVRVDEQGQLAFVVDSGLEEGYEPITVGVIYDDPSELLAQNARTLDHPIVEQDFYTDIYGTFLSAYAPIYKNDGTRVGIVGVDIFADKVVAEERAVLYLILGTIGAALVIVTLLGLWLGTTFTRPILDLSHMAQKVSEGNLDARAEIETTDEIGDLARIFNATTDRLQRILSSLEQRVADRTRNLELAAEVGRAVSQVRELDAMLKDACDLILKEFNLYYVQVYLADPSQTTLILEAGTGSVGAELLGRGHRLQLDTSSINGRAAVEERAVVISDTAASATFRPNPLLPETRGEMSIPLIIGDKVMGVLDIQDRNAGKLTEEVLPAFEALAGQLAVAIQNANLVAEAEQARAEVEAQARRLERTSWSDYLDAVHKPEQLGFVFAQNEVTPLTEIESSFAENDGQAVLAPISLSGEQFGSLVVEVEDETRKENASELVNIVARQVAQQIENLRLLESTERYRQEAEQAARRQTREGWREYVNTRKFDNLGFLYDLNKVLPYNNGHDDNESLLTLPLKIRNEEVGKLSVQGLPPDDSESIAFANAVAERLGAHIESLRQYDQARSALTQSERLFEASRRLTQATDLQELVAVTVETLSISAVNRAVLGIFSYDANGEFESMDIKANWWDGTGHEVTAIGTRYPVEVFRTVSLFTSPTPIFFDDALNDPRTDATTLNLAKRINLRAVAVLPLYLGTRQVGVLMLEAEQPHNFSQDEIRLFSALAPQLATILENRDQFERAQKQAERETMLNTINQKIQGATSVEAVLQIAARELGHALGAPMTIAQLSMKDQK